MSNDFSRRIFLGAATAASATRVWGANERINVAIVGLGGRGGNHLNIFSKLPETRVVGLCDANQAARERAQATLLKNTHCPLGYSAAANIELGVSPSSLFHWFC